MGQAIRSLERPKSIKFRGPTESYSGRTRYSLDCGFCKKTVPQGNFVTARRTEVTWWEIRTKCPNCNGFFLISLDDVVRKS